MPLRVAVTYFNPGKELLVVFWYLFPLWQPDEPVVEDEEDDDDDDDDDDKDEDEADGELSFKPLKLNWILSVLLFAVCFFVLSLLPLI